MPGNARLSPVGDKGSKEDITNDNRKDGERVEAVA
jgi:hypothetical protein